MTVAGVVVLLVNDHVLKEAWPGFVTGKLSDVAGLLVAPALVALLFRRRADPAVTVLTGGLFALVKTTETGAEAASYVWTLVAGPSRVLADPTDLLALPALALAWWVRGRTLRDAAPALHGPPAALPATISALRGLLPVRWRVLMTLPFAVLAVAATAASPGATSATWVDVERNGRLVMHTDGHQDYFSGDGGLTWTETRGDWEADGDAGQSAMCVPGQATRCYQVVKDRMAVEQSDDGGKTWQPSWSASGDDLERIRRQYDTGDHPADLRSRSLVVQARPGGHVVVVANGADGILVRDTSGTWQRVGWPDSPRPEVGLGPEFAVAFFLGACMLFGGVGAGLRQYARAYMGFAAAACVGLLSVLSDWFLPASSGGLLPWLDGEGPFLMLLGAFATLVGTVVCLVLAIAGRARPAPVAVGVIGAPLVYGSVYLPFHGWSVGMPAAYWMAITLAVLLTGLVVAAGAVLVRNDGRNHSDGMNP